MSVPSERQGSRVRGMFSAIAGRYDLANHLLSGGLDFSWRKYAAQLVRSRKPQRILDLATGSGDLARSVHAVCPEATIVAADFCHTMLKVAQRKGVARLVVADGLRLPFPAASFDVVTIAFGLRNMESWSGGLTEMARVLRQDGCLLILDFSVPPPPLRWIYRPYLHYVLPHAAALLTGERSAYEYLGDSIETFPAGESMCELIRSAGFKTAQVQPLTGGIVSLYLATR